MNLAIDVTTHPGILYTERDARPLALDLYLPEASISTVPVLLYLHGGAWITGSRAENSTRLRSLARAGMAVASIDYTFVQDAAFPAQLQNILDAAGWLTRHAEEYGLDISRTVVGGSSAGGHLALLSTLLISDGTVPTPALPEGFLIVGTLVLFASLDLTSTRPLVDESRGLLIPDSIADAAVPTAFGGAHPSPAARAALLAGVAEGDLTDEILTEFSPVYRLHPDAPPVLLLHGTADALVAAENSIRFHNAAQAAGVDTGLVLVDGANHEDIEFESPATIARMAAFVLRGDTGRSSD